MCDAAIPDIDLLRQVYAAFNARDIEAALALMATDVSWPRAFKGGVVRGPEQVRTCWLEQWSESDPHVQPMGFHRQQGDTFLVEVEQRVRDLAGRTLVQNRVGHRFTLAGGLIHSMEVCPLPSAPTEPHSLSDEQIITAWQRNAAPWTLAVRENRIASRQRVTNRAVLEAAASRAPRSALDLGCGEGWLSHRLAEQGVRVLGVDAVAELIEVAQARGRARFQRASYEAIARGAISERFDVAIANFSLLGHQAVEGLFGVMPELLTPGGALIVQSMHPTLCCGDLPYADGWRAGSWAGIPGDFGDPAPWFFRTIESWTQLFRRNGLAISGILEPIDPVTRRPASILFLGELIAGPMAPSVGGPSSRPGT